MRNISTSLTIFLKLFIPIFWMVFFGAFTVGTFIKDIAVGPFLPSTFRWVAIAFFLLGSLLFYFTIMRIKRVDMDNEFMYVSNYFKTVRYPYGAIDKIKERDWLLFHTVHVSFRKTGIFGGRIVFLCRGKKLSRFLKAHPEAAERLFEAVGETDY
ncbi:MAG: hypothetical protein AB8F74_06230 [Saprospiraceae bacterium]